MCLWISVPVFAHAICVSKTKICCNENISLIYFENTVEKSITTKSILVEWTYICLLYARTVFKKTTFKYVNSQAFFVAEMDIREKLDSYQTANRSVARLCNHQKAVPKNFEQQLEKVQDKVNL